MIVEKIYRIRYDAAKDLDEVITIIAEDIKNGFTTKKIEYCSDRACVGTVRTEPNFEVEMVKKWTVTHG